MVGGLRFKQAETRGHGDFTKKHNGINLVSMPSWASRLDLILRNENRAWDCPGKETWKLYNAAGKLEKFR